MEEEDRICASSIKAEVKKRQKQKLKFENTAFLLQLSPLCPKHPPSRFCSEALQYRQLLPMLE